MCLVQRGLLYHGSSSASLVMLRDVAEFVDEVLNGARRRALRQKKSVRRLAKRQREDECKSLLGQVLLDAAMLNASERRTSMSAPSNRPSSDE